MSKYLYQVNYTLEGVKGLLAKGGFGNVMGHLAKGGSPRRAAAQYAAKSLGGELEFLYFAFGMTDAYAVFDLPEHDAAAALAMTMIAGGGVTVNTTVLLTPEQIDIASDTAVEYRPPGFS